LKYFVQSVRWAKADMVQQVSRLRLNRPRTNHGRDETKIPFESVDKIQRAVIKAISAASLLPAINT
jgi:uncharacterized protein YifN (PemK superfamily)